MLAVAWGLRLHFESLGEMRLYNLVMQQGTDMLPPHNNDQEAHRQK